MHSATESENKMNKLKELIAVLKSYSRERAYIVSCLKAAVRYCKQQYEDSGIDWLPSARELDLQDEHDKFALLEYYLNDV